jgi:hypothetical protein
MPSLRSSLVVAAIIAASALPVGCATAPTPTPAPTAQAQVSPSPAPMRTVVVTATGTAAATTPTVAPTAAASPSAATSPTVATTPTGSPAALTPSPTGPACPAQVVRGFAIIYNREKAVADKLKCPVTAETGIQLSVQKFQNGAMVQWAGSPEIIVMRADGTWTSYPNTWKEGEALPPAGTPPAGTFAPQRGFGKLWSQTPEVKQALGWATTTEQQNVTGASQGFAGGRMVWTPDKYVYVIYNDHTWQGFPDVFTG